MASTRWRRASAGARLSKACALAPSPASSTITSSLAPPDAAGQGRDAQQDLPAGLEMLLVLVGLVHGVFFVCGGGCQYRQRA
jgi:hypothetical protein